MSRDLINELSKLELEKCSLKRNLDKYSYDYKLRSRLFENIQQINNQINITKFKLRLEREKRKNDIKY